MNIVKLLGITYKEDIISNLIVGLINESKSFRNSFIRSIFNIENPSNFDIKAYTRIATSVGVPDIVITLENDNCSRLLIIENKLKADEGINQTLRYSDEKCVADLVNNKLLGLKNKDVKIEFIFLTLMPEQSPIGNEFKNITYKDIIEDVKVEIEDKVLERIYYDFIFILKDFYKDLDINEDDKLIDSLSNEEDKDRAFIKFKKIAKCINCNGGLSVREIGKAGGVGRVSYYAKISKDSWIGKDEAKLINNTYKITKDSYDIHLEPSFDIFNKKIILPLHYESRPYIPKKD
ncbi:PD-(D/E)XK nuclease family protein [[Clostridium] dakarense]|uniref:PD-(D/E)XK nuclease family protein n=1 Tax=Faecalimicrobium dakarense TaxID=1301100 RepID=UPI0004B56A99|nr:PD-(D/E)XK nuclease family protein [[Clostridium] dakarense]